MLDYTSSREILPGLAEFRERNKSNSGAGSGHRIHKRFRTRVVTGPFNSSSRGITVWVKYPSLIKFGTTKTSSIPSWKKIARRAGSPPLSKRRTGRSNGEVKRSDHHERSRGSLLEAFLQRYIPGSPLDIGCLLVVAVFIGGGYEWWR